MDDLDNQIFDPEDIGVSPSETAKILGVTEETLATWRSQGRGPKFRKPGRHVEYTPKFIRDYLATRVRTPESAAVRRQRAALAKQSNIIG